MRIHKIAAISLALMSFFAVQEIIAATDASSSKASDSQHPTLTFDQIKMAAESGDPDAQYALGYMFYYGKSGAPKNVNLAKTWIAKAANQKQPQAMKALALMTGVQSEVTENKVNTSEVASKVSTEQTKATVVQEESPRKYAQEQKSDQKDIKSVEELASQQTSEKMTLVTAQQPAETETKKAEVVKNEEPTDSGAIYTLQLLGSYNKAPIKKLIKDHHLQKGRIYQTTFKGKTWYVLVYGHYATRSDAKKAAQVIESKLSLQPWVKPLASVKHLTLISTS